MERVRMLRRSGCSRKEIARTLGLPPARVAPLVRAIAEEDQAAENEILGCWVSPGWSEGLTVETPTEWQDVDATDAGAAGLVAVLIARQAGRGRACVCGYLVDVYCLGVKDVLRPQTMDGRRVLKFSRSFFAAYRAQPLAAPLDLAQHLVLGAVDYARSLGFEPAAGFEEALGHLGSWEGPSAIGFGRDGTPHYVQGPRDDAASVLNTLERSVGRDNFHFLVCA